MHVEEEQMRRCASRLFLAGLLAVSLVGCSSWWPFGESSGEVPRVPPGATAYKCDGNKDLYVRYVDGGKSAMVIYPEREFRLDAAETGSGARYTNGRTTLRTKGSEATLEEGSAIVYSNCKSGG
jgi:membrane-bound inhibitor of C-type lysozyme